MKGHRRGEKRWKSRVEEEKEKEEENEVGDRRAEEICRKIGFLQGFNLCGGDHF